MDLNEVSYQLQEAGLCVEIPALNQFMRCKVNDDKGSKRSGWYFVYEYQARNGQLYYGGVYGNWKIHDGNGVKIRFQRTGLVADDLAEIKKRNEQARRQQAQEKKARQEEAATRAERIWSKLPQSGKSDYLQRKKVKAHGLRFCRGSIVIPVRKLDGTLTGLQFIQGNGDKKFLTGTEKQGCCFVLGDQDEAEARIICEGYATAASVFEATGYPVYVAFDAGNIQQVVGQLRDIYPRTLLVIAGDHDQRDGKNKGRMAAEKAAGVHGAIAVFPELVDGGHHAVH